MDCVLSPGGRMRLATASFGEFCVRLWNLESGRRLRTLTGHPDAMVDVAWGQTTDGRLLLATTSLANTARIWDPASGQGLRAFRAGGDDEIVIAVAWGTGLDGSRVLVTGSYNGTVRIWDPATGILLAPLPGTGSAKRAAGWIRDGGGNLLLLINPHDAAVPVRAWLVEMGADSQR